MHPPHITFVSIGRIDDQLSITRHFVVIDVAYVLIYLERGSVIFALTFAIYAAMAVYGYRAWRREMRAGAIANRIAGKSY